MDPDSFSNGVCAPHNSVTAGWRNVPRVNEKDRKNMHNDARCGEKIERRRLTNTLT